MPKHPNDVPIRKLEEFARQYDLEGAALVAVRKDGTVQAVTWGRTRHKCKAIGWWMKGTMDQCLSHVPFRTVFGWGNDGVPKPLTQDEKDNLPIVILNKLPPEVI